MEDIGTLLLDICDVDVGTRLGRDESVVGNLSSLLGIEGGRVQHEANLGATVTSGDGLHKRGALADGKNLAGALVERVGAISLSLVVVLGAATVRWCWAFSTQ